MTAAAAPAYTVVVPTLARPSLGVLLDALATASGPRPAEVLLVDDRPLPPPSTVTPGPRHAGVSRAGVTVEAEGGLRVRPRPGLPPVRVVRGGGRGPAAARNLGWRLARTEWVAFLDDDVVPDPDWYDRLAVDLAGLDADVAGSQGRVRVPLPAARRPTDWERSTAGLASARWITADMAYRRAALSAVGGFDERFRLAFREDADLALRVLGAGLRLVQGERGITHPVRPARWTVSVRVQAGNADDVLMRRLHGPGWRERAGTPRGRRRRHLAVTAAGTLGLAAGAAGLVGAAATAASSPRQRAARTAAAAGLGLWLAGTAELAAARIRPGPRDRAEVARMALTSVAIPPAATWHYLRGLVRHRGAAPWRGVPELVLLDRDGTLVVDVPYNGDPAAVAPVPGAREALDRLRVSGIRLGVVTNQSGVARGLLTRAQVDAVNARVERLLGPFDVWQVCPHGPDDGCACRKPAPGMVKEACAALGVDPARSVLIGDIGSDVSAALAAGAGAMLVPTPVTRPEEVAAAPVVAADLGAAVDVLLRGDR